TRRAEAPRRRIEHADGGALTRRRGRAGTGAHPQCAGERERRDRVARGGDSRPGPRDPAPAWRHQARVNLNADIGEGAGEDEAILACVDSANIACGVHAGSTSLAIAAAWRCRIPAYREGFADRLMLPDGSLAPRSQAGAVLSPTVAAQQAVGLARSGRYDTICVHGDSPGAGHIAAAVRQALREAGIETAPPGR